MHNASKQGYAPVGKLEMYYEIHGTGKPLLMLHGEFTTAGMFSELVPELAKSHQVILTEQQGHGHTADIDRLLTFGGMAEDTANLLKYLEITTTDVFGYSAGGSVALELAVRHPKLVHSLALASAAYDLSGYPPELAEGLKHITADFLPPILRQEYEKVAPQSGNWEKLVAKVAAMASSQATLTAEKISTLSIPAVVIMGDNDIVLPQHAQKLANLLDTKLVIVPGDHSSYLTQNPAVLLHELQKFYASQPEKEETA